MPQAELPRIYSAADALVLASDREGWPNVLLEAMACGTPVVATRVGGVPEVVTSAAAGILVDDPSPDAIAAAARRLLSEPPDRNETRAYAEAFSWDDTTQGQLSLFERILAGRSSA
jgi:glycosyltransferase involved in cell wall biosynthesis